MTKEEWIKVRGEPEIPLGVWFSFYREQGGTCEDPIYFEKAFNTATSSCIIIEDIWGRMKQVTKESARKRLFSYYNKIFNLCEI